MRQRVPLLPLACLFSIPVLTAVAIWYGILQQDRIGNEEWAAALQHAKAATEPTSYESLIPPLVPDSDNLATTDLFRVDWDEKEKAHRMLKLREALHNVLGENSPATFGNYVGGHDLDRTKLYRFLSQRYEATFHRAGPSSTLVQFDELCPALTTLQQAAATRRNCRFDRDYISQPPYNRELSDIATLIKLAKVLDYHGVTALNEHRPDIAFQDFEILQTLAAGLRREPLLVSGLVSIAIFSLGNQILWEGIESDGWSDAQLALLQEQFCSIDYLADGQLCARGEALGALIPMLDWIQTHHQTSAALISGPTTMQNLEERIGWRMMPSGWFDSARALALNDDFAAARTTDPKAHRFYPGDLAALLKRNKKARSTEIPARLAIVAIGPVLSASGNFAEAQFRADAARIAIMIGRYRLAHGALPASLDDLTAFGPVPHDLCNGEPYHYAVRPDKTYLLYSVGWNLTDDHGEVVPLKGKPSSTDFDKGDWVWPQPGHTGS